MNRILALLLAALALPLSAAEQPAFTAAMITAAERSDYARTSTLAEVVAVLNALDDATTLMHRERLLLTRQGRDVPIVVLADPPVSSPAQARDSGKPVIYLQGNIHGGEVEGKEASLILMRDILLGDKQHLLDNQILVFVPVYNADGNDAMAENTRPNQELSPVMTGVRTAHGLDLNRDGMIIDADETRALYEQVINRWDPDLLVDLHTTNGTWHGYSLTWAPSYHTVGDPAPSDYTAEVMLPAITDRVKEKFDLDFGWYGGYDYRDWPPTELRTFHHAPRYLTNNMALRNRMAILSETFSHDRFYKRVHAANAFIEEILEYTHVHGDEIRRINRAADARVAAMESGDEQGVAFTMVARDEPIDLLSYRYIPYRAADGSTDFVRSSELVVIADVANFNAFRPIRTATRPSAYLFRAAFAGLADKLRQHGIDVEVLEADSTFAVEVFAVNAVDQQSFVQNGHRNSLLDGEFRRDTRSFSRGDYLVSMDTRLANLIFYLLEPQADDGLAYWNLFDAFLEAELQRQGTAEYPVYKLY
ncbi:MAG: hypothetical protein PsegKO_24890 [Pseudohongiellaceae bacterium]